MGGGAPGPAPSVPRCSARGCAAARRFGSDKPGAFLEDGVAAVLGWLGARRPAV